MYKKRGIINEKEVDEANMKVLEARKSYLFKRLKTILDDRDPLEADEIRN